MKNTYKKLGALWRAPVVQGHNMLAATRAGIGMVTYGSLYNPRASLASARSSPPSRTCSSGAGVQTRWRTQQRYYGQSIGPISALLFKATMQRLTFNNNGSPLEADLAVMSPVTGTSKGILYMPSP